MPRGGRRIGAGRKPKPAHERMLGRVLPHPSAPPVGPPAPIEEFDPPADLDAEAREVWLRQAPFAFQNRTLTKATTLAFTRYCRMVVQERIDAASSAANGTNHRGLRKELNTLEIQFMLTAAGKPIAQPASVQAPANPLARFLK